MGTVVKKLKRSELPVQVPLFVVTGDDFVSPTFRHKNPNDGSPRDLNGCTINCKFRSGPNEDAPEVHTPTVVRNDAAGEYYLEVDRTTTAGWTGYLSAADGTAGIFYDIELIDTLDKKTTYYGGPVYIKRSTT